MIGLYKTLISSRVKGQRIPQVGDVVTVSHICHIYEPPCYQNLFSWMEKLN